MARGKILIVEDDRDIVEMVEYNLKEEGYDTLSAFNGEDGVELAGKKLGRRTLAELVKADGFSTKNDFFTYFEKSSENGIFDGVLIKW